jgi:hypothetical protein
MSNSWKIFYKEGTDYWNAAVKSVKRPEIFNPEVVYNIVCMAIEKFFMAFLIYHKKMPYNHTLIDLVESVKLVYPVDPHLEENLRFMDSLQEICAIDSITVKKITERDRLLFFETGQMVFDFVKNTIKEQV